LKIDVDCPECLVHRGLMEISKFTGDRERRIRASAAVLKVIAENLQPNAVPGAIGTMREVVIRRETGNPDLYTTDKQISNMQALRLIPKLEEKIANVNDGFERFKLAVRFSTIGNIIEFDILGYNAKLDELDSQFKGVRFGIDDCDEAFRLANLTKRVLLLTDNAGEIAFDKLLVRELRQVGLSVTVAVKSAPIMNDATLDDAVQVGLDRDADRVITTGGACVGLLFAGTSPEFRQALGESDLIIAKGMGHYETMTERDWTQPVLHLLVAKCRPVAASLGIEKGQGAIYLRRPKL